MGQVQASGIMNRRRKAGNHQITGLQGLYELLLDQTMFAEDLLTDAYWYLGHKDDQDMDPTFPGVLTGLPK